MKRFLQLYRHAKQLKRQGILKRSAFRFAVWRWWVGDKFMNYSAD